MSLTVLQIAQSFAAEVNIPLPTTFVSVTDPADLQILNLINSISRDFRRERIWPQQKKQYTFTLTAARTKNPLPQDFYSPLLGTERDTIRKIGLNGPVSDANFATALYGFATDQNQIRFRIFGPDSNPNTGGGQFMVYPTPAGGEILYFEYLTKNLFLPPNWTPSEAGITTSKYRNANGNIYKCSAITTGTTSTTPPSHTTGTAVDGGVTWTYIAAPYETVIADEDLSLFDDDIMILGLKAKWYQMKGLGYEALAEETAKALDEARGRLFGSFIGSFNRYGNYWRRYSPTTSGGWSF